MKRNAFNLSYTNLLSCDMGELVPVGVTEVLPGDSFVHNVSALIRTQPLLAPIMHRVNAQFYSFFVPHRLVWEDWEDFITGGPDGLNASTFPTITLSYAAGTPPTGSGVVGGLADYLGCPPAINNLQVSALPFRAYGLIFNEWFRDQDLVAEVVIDQTSGADTTTNTALLHAAWEKDYLTSARPWAQKGPVVSLPLSGEAPVTGLGWTGTPTYTSGANIRETTPGSSVSYTTAVSPSSGYPLFKADTNGATGRPQVFADLSNVTAATVNELRLAMALQRYEENRARYGSRYVEYLRMWGVRSSDARLQRPEYLGGGKQTLQFSEVLQTSNDVVADEVIENVGAIRGHGIGGVRSARYMRFFEEHGYIMTLMVVRPRTMYVQRLERTWNRRTKEDFFQHELQHIGQQQVLNKEVYAASGTPDGVFGYQDRYDEYRRNESRVAGEFRTSTLDFWHMARIFGSAPTLNGAFVQADPTKRVFPVQSEDTDALWVMINHNMRARRKLDQTGRSFIF